MQTYRQIGITLLILLLVAVAGAACTDEGGAPDSTAAPPPTAQPPDVEAIVEAAVRRTMEALPTPVPAPTPDIESIVESVLQRTIDALPEGMIPASGEDSATPVGEETPPATDTESEGQSLDVQTGSAATLYSISGGFSDVPISPEVSERGGITVAASASVTVPADEAYVVLVPAEVYGPIGPEKRSVEDHEEIVRNLTDIGVGRDAIRFDAGQPFDPESISVKVQISDLPGIGNLIVDAVEDVVRRTERSGVRFGVSGDNCERALAEARREVFTQAESDSLHLANALGVSRGEIKAAIEKPQGYSTPGIPVPDKCGGKQFHPYLTPLLPFDADPEVEVSILMTITYGPVSEQNGGITAKAIGSVKSTADEAYVVVVPEHYYGPYGPESISGRVRADVIEAIEQVGVATDAVEFISGRQPYESVQISARVQVADLPEIGDLILDAVEGVIRRSEYSGVRFGLGEESCGRALEQARLDAISQVTRKADALAATLGMVRGGAVGAFEDTNGSFAYRPTGTDRCWGQFRDPYALLPFDAEPSVEVAMPLQITFAPQSDQTAGLVTDARSSLTVSADEAYVVVMPQVSYGPRGPVPLSRQVRADVMEKLKSIGIASVDVEIVSGSQPYGPVQISVKVAVEDLPEIGEVILDAVEDVLRRSEYSGVRFGLSEESCNAGLALVRRDANRQSERDAAGLAESMGVERGEVVSVVEHSGGGSVYGPSITETCGGQLQLLSALLPFGAEPKIAVAVHLQIGYAISR